MRLRLIGVALLFAACGVAQTIPSSRPELEVGFGQTEQDRLLRLEWSR